MSKAKQFLEKAKKASLASGKEGLDRIESLEAIIEASQTDPDTVLARLEGKEDPDSIRAKLVILRNANRISEAVDTVKRIISKKVNMENQAPAVHERWGDMAVFVLSANGDFDDASWIIKWSETQENRNGSSGHCRARRFPLLLLQLPQPWPELTYNGYCLVLHEAFR